MAVPVDYSDAATKGNVDTKNSQQDIEIYNKSEKTDVLLLDGSQSMNSDLDMYNHKIISLANATDNDEAVNFSQLKNHTDSHLNNYHLQKSFTFFKNFGDKSELTKISLNPFSGHDHHDLYRILKESSDPGFRGEALVRLKMTNNLPAGIYTSVFETFSGTSLFSPSNITQLNDETLLQQVHGDANLKIITFSHDYQTTHSKAYIQFSSNGQAGEITFQIRYYGSSYNDSSLAFYFYSRVISGKIGTFFNHAIFDIDDVQLKNQILYFEDLNLNGNSVKNISPAEEMNDAVNLRQIIDIYQPYVYELSDFQFFKQNIKLNTINVAIRPNLPADNIIRKHNHHVSYITNFFSGITINNKFISAVHGFRNLNLDAGDYTFILEMLSEAFNQPYNFTKKIYL